MRKELLTLAVACLLCVPAFAADDEEPKGVSDIKEVGKVMRNPITIEATGGNQKMDVVFNHSSHRRVRCQTCHHALPSDIDAKYVSCGASEECHSVPRGDDGVAPSLFKAFHAKDSDHSCYGCHIKKRKQYTGFQKGCLPCHEKAQKDPKVPAVAEKTLN